MRATKESSLCADTSSCSSAAVATAILRASLRHSNTSGTSVKGERRADPAAACLYAVLRMRPRSSVWSWCSACTTRESGVSSSARSSSMASSTSSATSPGASRINGATKVNSAFVVPTSATTLSCSVILSTRTPTTFFWLACDRCAVSVGHDASCKGTSTSAWCCSGSMLSSLSSVARLDDCEPGTRSSSCPHCSKALSTYASRCG
mmetsp:Transcript_47733/g.110646  ORF Transcript_47733/g.110646 Transcript_47733/m.110646 type:complete len:206 (-) Transcript_47733:1120-1737(-)